MFYSRVASVHFGRNEGRDKMSVDCLISPGNLLNAFLASQSSVYNVGEVSLVYSSQAYAIQTDVPIDAIWA